MREHEADVARKSSPDGQKRVWSSNHQGANKLANIEQIEMDRRRSSIVVDMKKLVEKYRAIFDWDVPDINQNLADKMILEVMRKSLDDIEKNLLG